jgi:hypothetical protein
MAGFGGGVVRGKQVGKRAEGPLSPGRPSLRCQGSAVAVDPCRTSVQMRLNAATVVTPETGTPAAGGGPTLR